MQVGVICIFIHAGPATPRRDTLNHCSVFERCSHPPSVGSFFPTCAGSRRGGGRVTNTRTNRILIF